MRIRNIPPFSIFVIVYLLVCNLQTASSQNLSNLSKSDWIQRGGHATYEFVDNQIIGTSVVDNHNSFLCTIKEYGDFELNVDVKVDTAMNSGIQIRSESKPNYQDGRVHGYQVEIDPSKRAWSGGIYDEGRRGWLVNLEDNEPGRKAFKNGEFNHYRIVAKGTTIKTWVNGVLTADLNDDMTLKGFIAFQVHGTKIDKPMQVIWKNITLKEL